MTPRPLGSADCPAEEADPEEPESEHAGAGGRLCSVSEERRLFQTSWKAGTGDTLAITTLACIYVHINTPPPPSHAPPSPPPGLSKMCRGSSAGGK